jgi:Domain of unknown function (DUF4157)
MKTKVSTHTSPAKSLTRSRSAHQPFFQKSASMSESEAFSQVGIQAKLTVGQPGDRYEREADSMADRVVSRQPSEANEQGGLIRQISPVIQRQAEEEEVQTQAEEEETVQAQEEEEVQSQTEEEEETIQAQEEEEIQAQGEEEEEMVQAQEEEEEEIQAQAEEEETVQAQEEEEGVQAQAEEEEETIQRRASPEQPCLAFETSLRSQKGQGSPLPSHIRNKMEDSFQADFSGIRIHTNEPAVKLSKQFHAQAFTHGRDIYFNKGKFSPNTRQGEHLLAHELTHTVQQGAVTSKEMQPDSNPSVLLMKEDNGDMIHIRPELLQAIKIARQKIGKVNAKIANADKTRMGWEHLYEFFNTAFGGKDVIHKDVIKFISTKYPMPSWCGIFVWWSLKKSGIPIPDWQLGVPILGKVAVRQLGELPRKGDIAYKGPSYNDHFALVTGIENPSTAEGKSFKSIKVATVNGNTSGDDNLGGQIEEKWEPIGKWLAFFDPVAKLDLPPVPLVETSVVPDEGPVDDEGEPQAGLPEPVTEQAPTEVAHLEEDIVSELDPLPSGESEIAVELPAPVVPQEEEIAEVEALDLEGSSDQAMVGFLEASPSQMAVTQPALGMKLDDKIHQEKQDEVDNAPVLVASTSGTVNEGLTPPDKIPVPDDAHIKDGTTGPDPGKLEAGAHENFGATPSNQENEKLLDKKEDGGFLRWFRNNITSFLQRIKTKDSTLNTKAGERPNVRLEGEAAPERMDNQRDEAKTQLIGQRDASTEVLKNHPGQTNIQPKEIHEEKPVQLSPEVPVNIATSEDPGVADYANAPLPSDVRTRTDELLAPELESNLREAKTQTQEASQKRDQDKKIEISNAESEAKQINESADKDQREIVITNRQDVARQQKEGIEDAYGQVNEFTTEADKKHTAERKEIGDKVKESEGKAKKELEKGEADAEKKKQEEEKKAAAKKEELDREQKKGSWWDRVASAIKSAVKAITKAIDVIFTALRDAVKFIIETAKKAAIGLINAARTWIVDKLNKFRDWAKDKVNTYLKDRFPALAERINNGIDAVVDTAIAGVNAVADAAIAGIEKFANALAAALDKILQVFQTALKAAVQIAGAVLTGDFAGALRIAIQAGCDIAGINSKPIFDFIDRAVGQVTNILKAPKKFFNNLMMAVGNGIRNFVDNIKKHLINGLLGWLTGALSEADITIPKTLDFKGVLSLGLQILGLTKEQIKAKIVKRYPPAAKIFGAIEKGMAIAFKLFKEGPIALWQEIKKKLANLKDFVLAGIKKFVITTVVQEAMTWLLGMLNPAGALVKILSLIYRLVMFLVERFQQIKDFILSVYESVTAIASGALGKATAAVEGALSRSLPVVISLLARLAGLGGIGKTVQNIIGKVRKPIDKFIIALIDKIVKFAKKLLGKGKATAKQAKKAIGDLFFPKKKFQAGRETHTISFRKAGDSHQLIIASAPLPAEKFLSNIESEHGDSLSDKQKEKIQASRALIKNKIHPLEKRIKTANKEDPKKAKPLMKQMLALEVELSNHLRLILGTTNALLDAQEKYKLEGLTGTFASMPTQKGDQLTPDHQPQAAILEYGAAQAYFKDDPKGQKMVERGAGRAHHGYAINLHEIRHKDGRTYGHKGKATKADFIAKATAEIPSLPSAQKKRTKFVQLLKAELKADVAAINSVVSKPGKDIVWRDINALNIAADEKKKLISQSRQQIKRGELVLASQGIESLKG